MAQPPESGESFGEVDFVAMFADIVEARFLLIFFIL